LFSTNGEANEAFGAWSKDYVLFLHITSYVYEDKNHDLFSHRGGFGYPYLAFLDDTGQLLSQVKARDLHGLAAAAEAARKLQAVRAKADQGDNAAAVQLFRQRLEMDGLSFPEAKATYARLREFIAADARPGVEQLITNREISGALDRLREEHGRDMRKFLPATAAEYFRAGKVPTNRLAGFYFDAVLQHAQSSDDIELARAALAKAEAFYGDDPGAQRTLKSFRAKLEAMTKGG